MALDQKMISMKRSAADKRADKLSSAPMEAMAPDYPYGLCIHMDGDEMEKLGIDKLPEVGEEYVLVCRCKVTMASQRATTDTRGEDYRSIDLQITEIGWEEGA